MAEKSEEKKFSEQFQRFSKFGVRESDGRYITLTQSDKWMRQARVIDGKVITSTDTAICFKKFKAPKLPEADYQKFLIDLATIKTINVGDIKQKMVTCGIPGFTTAVASAKATSSTVERLTDPAKYTGSHKERFDEAGKGKGLAGRREEFDDSGYVSGYANKDSYDKDKGHGPPTNTK